VDATNDELKDHMTGDTENKDARSIAAERTIRLMDGVSLRPSIAG
jgi:hypothetical protein